MTTDLSSNRLAGGCRIKPFCRTARRTWFGECDAAVRDTSSDNALVRLTLGDIENQNVRCVFFARGQAFVDQVCHAGPSTTGRHAEFNKFIEIGNLSKPASIHVFRNVLACEWTCATSSASVFKIK